MTNFKQPIVINGTAGSGKDTFVDISKKLLSGYGLSVFSYSAVDQVKHWAMQLGWDGVKDEKGRQLLFDLKMVSVKYNDGPTRYLLSRVETIEDGLIFMHIREPEEIMKLKAVVPDALLLHIDRPGLEILHNGADNRTREIEYDHYINNDGDLDGFARKCADFINLIIPDEIKRELVRTTGESLTDTLGRLR